MAMYRNQSSTAEYNDDDQQQVQSEFDTESADAQEAQEEYDDETEEDRAAEIFNDDEPQNLWCYVNQVSLQGRLYFKDEIKIQDTTISNKVASFNLLIKKNTKNGVKKHRIYVKTYNKDIIEWLMQQQVGTWVKVEGRLEAASNKTYVNATSITAFSEERIKAIFEGFKDTDNASLSADWNAYEKDGASEMNKIALEKLRRIKHQTRQIAMNSNSVYINDEDTPVAAAASKKSLTEEDISEITAKTQELVDSYNAYLESVNNDDDDEEEDRAKDRELFAATTMKRFESMPELINSSPKTDNANQYRKHFVEPDTSGSIDSISDNLEMPDLTDLLGAESFGLSEDEEDEPVDDMGTVLEEEEKSAPQSKPAPPQYNPPGRVVAEQPPSRPPVAPVYPEDLGPENVIMPPLPVGARLVRSEIANSRRSGRSTFRRSSSRR